MAQTKADLTDEISRLKSRIASLEETLEHRNRVEAVLSELLEDLPVLFWTTDCNLLLKSVAGAVAGEMDRPPDEAIGMPIQKYLGSYDPSFLPVTAAMRALGGETVRFSCQIRGRAFQVSTGPVYDRMGKIAGTIALALDSTDQFEIEARIQSAESRYRDLIDAVSDIVLWYDVSGTIVLANGAAERALGTSSLDLRGRSASEFVAEENKRVFLERTATVLGGTSVAPFEIALVSDCGRRITVEITLGLVAGQSGDAERVHLVARDLTERRNIAGQLRQAQKMQAIGVLAGAVAHDFNNLLTGILGHAYLLESSEAIRRRHSASIDAIVRSSEKAAHLTGKLLSLARQGKSENAPTDLHSTVRDVVDLLQRTIDREFRVVANLQAAPSYVLGDSAQLYQLLLSLCLNARDAMLRGGDIRIHTRNSGSSIVLSVQDTGTGIAEEIRARIFEPFFTTKDPNQGAGLGLAMASGIARNHGGTIHFDSEPGTGTTFHVTLPACDPTGRAIPARRELKRGRGRLLVIDHEPAVRQVLARMLTILGYEVEAPGEASEGIDYYRHNAGSIDAVILDLGMPKLTGRECLMELRRINPDVRAVLTSNLTKDEGTRAIPGYVEFLQKPYRMQDLANVVSRAVLKETAGGAGVTMPSSAAHS